MTATDELQRLLDDFEHECFMIRVGASETRARDDVVRKAYEQQREKTAQAIAATLGAGECIPHGEWESISQSQEVRHVFCDCGYELGMDERDLWPFRSTRLFAMPNYCQECGRRIRKRAVER